MDEEQIKCLLMRPFLKRSELQIFVDEIYKLFISSQLHFSVHHIPGNENKSADVLSREAPSSNIDFSKLLTELQWNSFFQLISDLSFHFNSPFIIESITLFVFTQALIHNTRLCLDSRTFTQTTARSKS